MRNIIKKSEYRTRANPYKGLYGTAALLKEVSDLGGPYHFAKKYCCGKSSMMPHNNKQIQKKKLCELEQLLVETLIS